MKVVYSPRYHIDIGAHIFPTLKYQLLAERLRGAHGDFLEPTPAAWTDLALVHTAEYLNKVQTGNFTAAELAQLEIPWSPDVIEGFRLMSGGTILAAQTVITASGAEVACHIGGGFHHAFANHGEGFCVFNDIAVSIRRLVQDGSITRAGVVDLDVHHGNGTAFIFEKDPSVFTFSMHQQHNYPEHKPRGSLDIGLPDGITDSAYLNYLAPALEHVFAHRPDIVFYLAGADPFRDDQLGGLALTKGGLRERDRTVFRACALRQVPVVVTLAGGYARNIEDTVDIHHATIDEAARV